MRIHLASMAGCAALALALSCGKDQPAPARAEAALAAAPTAFHRAPLAPGNVGVTVAKYMMKRWPHLELEDAACTDCFSLNYPTTVAGAMPTPAPKYWEYTNGVPLFAIQKLYERTGNAAYFDYVKQFVDHFVAADGTINYGTPPTQAAKRNDPTIQDTMQPATLLFQVYQATGDPKYLAAMRNARAVFDTIRQSSAGAFWHKPNYARQQWLDAIYMSEPFLTRYGALYADEAAPGDSETCFEMATTQIKLLDAAAFNPRKRLHYHGWNGDEAHDWTLNITTPDGKQLGCGLCAVGKLPPLPGTRVSPILWSRSIAWYLAGIVDVLEYLPRDHADRGKLAHIVRNIAEGLRTYQDPATGLWFQVIDAMDGPAPAEGGYPGEGVQAQPNWRETSASAIFVYSLAKAARLGLIGPEYLHVAKKGWAGVKTKVVIAGSEVTVKDTVVGMSLGGTWNAYTNASPASDVALGIPTASADAGCAGSPAGGTYRSPAVNCRYVYLRDNVPQGFAAVMLAASEMEF